MTKLDKRKMMIAGMLSGLLTFMHIAGWQISMDYGSSFYQSVFFQNIGVWEGWQCILVGSLEWILLSGLFYYLFLWFEKREKSAEVASASKVGDLRFFWIISFLLLYALWLLFLWGCYPGYYNYDVGNQLPQFMYEEVPYSAHHPLLHTLLEGFIITLGYRIYSVDLTLGVFLYNSFQMMICAGCLSYSLQFIYKRTRNHILTILAFVFYGFCPPIVMFAMSTTKDVMCYSILLVAFIRLWELGKALEEEKPVKLLNWIVLGLLLIFTCLLRKNIVYGLVIFALCSLLLIRKQRKKQLLLYIAVLIVYFVIDKGLLLALDAIPGSVNEAMCVPYQQMARLYTQVGKEAFSQEEYALFCEVIDPETLSCYDPAMGDYTKSSFFPGLQTIMEHKWDYFILWAKKGLAYPKIYIDSFLYNTYQVWYPATLVTEQKGVRYFDITAWQHEYGAPNWQGLFDFYEGIRFGSYAKWPLVRMLFSTGTMFEMMLITIFYSVWKKDKSMFTALLLILLVCGTSLCGPVSDVRYYLILFYLFPVCFGYLFQKRCVDKH